jgi:heme/copper-type cytochrome/quinol oxidase subunit 2
MIFLLYLVAVGAIIVPKPTSMSDMKKVAPDDSILSAIIGYILHYRWFVSLGLFIFICVVLLIVVSVVVYKKYSSKPETQKEPEEEIFVERRKLLLPYSVMLNGINKYYLSEDFDEKPKDNNSSEIFKETLISKLKLPKS